MNILLFNPFHPIIQQQAQSYLFSTTDCSLILQYLMNKKEKKSKGSIDSQEGENSANANPKETEKKEQYFQCKCGKKYGSLAAVHTHINNKHLNDKKQYKMAIKNPKKTGQGPSTSIRMKDIAYNEQEADLMCSSDTALKNIYDYIKKSDEQNKTNTSFLLDQNAIDSCEELDDDDDLDEINVAPRPQGTRDRSIREEVERLRNKYHLNQINDLLNNAKELAIFKIDKFNLTMIRELTKFFNLDFASKIHLHLEIITVKSRKLDKELQGKLSQVERELWGDKQKMGEILNEYYNSWNHIRGKDYKPSK